MRSPNPIHVLALGAAMLAGCQASDVILSERTVTSIGPEGGTAVSADGTLRLRFSPNALTEPVEISIHTFRDETNPRLRSPVFEFQPEGIQFRQAVIMEVAGLDPSEDLAIANLDGPEPRLLEDSEQDGGTVRATLAHFSSYGVVTAFNPCAGKQCGDTCTICDPSDANCTEPPPSNKACNASHLCVASNFVACTPSGDAGVPEVGGSDSGVPMCSETFTQREFPMGDVLLVIDGSGSMYDDLARISAELDLLERTLVTNRVDFQLGVTSVDPADQGALFGTPAILTSSTGSVAPQLAANIMAVPMGTGMEKGLLAAELALSANPTLLRPDAWLSIIFVSDEEDGSPSSVASYLASYESAAGEGRLQVNAIAGDVPGGCLGGGSSAEAGERYLTATSSAAGGVFRSICGDASVWGEALTELGGQGYGYQFRFSVSGAPATVGTVYVDGSPVDPADYVYDPATGTLIFLPDAIPGPLSSITVEYGC